MGCGASGEKGSTRQAPAAKAGKGHGKSAWHVNVSVLKAVSLKSMDLFTKDDAFCKVFVGETSKTTQVVVSNDPVWNRHFQFVTPPHRPVPSEVLVEVYDHDKFAKDDLIGIARVDLKDMWNSESKFLSLDLVREGKEDVQKRGTINVQVCAKEVLPGTKEYEGLGVVYSHLLALKVQGVKNIPKGEYHVELSWGTSKFATHSRKEDNPSFKETCSFWVNAEDQTNYKLKVSIVKGGKDVLTGFISASKLFDFLGGQLFDFDVALSELNDLTDKALSDIGKTPGDTDAQIQLSGRVQDFKSVELSFFDKLLETYDENKNGSLEPAEIWAVLNTLGLDVSGEEFDAWLEYADSNGDQLISRDEVCAFIDAISHTSQEKANTLASYLGQVLLDPKADFEHVDTIMEGVTQKLAAGELPIKDRETGLIVKENVPKYIKVALKVMFGSGISRILSTTKSSVTIMDTLSKKQGRKFDDPKSVEEIPGFVTLHNLPVDEVEKPLDQYKNFNEFFARKLKPEARPVASPDDPSVVVSPADCRMMVFPDVGDAKTLWIKGDAFSVENVFGPRKDLAPRFQNGSMCIARLAPQDYHRWHFPVGGKIVKRDEIAGALYTVNPLAIRKNVNVYTENKRHIVEIQSELYGTVVMVPVGATMVGSITYCVDDDASFNKGDIHGYFSFGGSTVLTFFEPGMIKFDADLLANSKQSLETLVKVNTHIGKAVNGAANDS